ncbi:glycosyltransferase family 21 protein [Teratosphaeria nubilosa]|uniref:Ceramide glucosyltransferase n=1 Tax=Teratosphaeria nubilosa TaxID=161662 RepID=A0A6G1L370_9PEZI|nr:glycosyltransferase family 21 protein [Teratosphaeria nubilosa]
MIWYLTVTIVSFTGFTQIWRHYSRPRQPAGLPREAPHVTVIRPIKGLEPYLYECLASTIRQIYPTDKTHIRFCISNVDEPSLPILKRLVEDFPRHDVQILVEAEDESLVSHALDLGPNPKIRNMSRAYREAPSDIVWIIDCNIWVAKGTLGRMVARLEGEGTEYRNKFVHQLPLVVDTEGSTIQDETSGLVDPNFSHLSTARPAHERTSWTIGGGRIEECFMSSAHPKFYVAINTVAVAPCIIGKSTMFRKSHLNSLTNDQGIDYFSQNICEDHLIGDLLWKQRIPEEEAGAKWGKHALCSGDLAVQPMANMSVREYWSRRVRWLRVRKFTVTLATFVEPGTESFLCSLYGAYAFTTLPVLRETFAIPPTWSGFAAFWLLSVSVWCFMDWILYNKLHSAASIEVDSDTPSFARSPRGGSRRTLGEWFLSWVGREALALPIWIWAFWLGTTVEWRGKRFWVGLDMKVHEIEKSLDGPIVINGHGKARNQ